MRIKGEGGYTLIEMMIVLLVVSTLLWWVTFSAVPMRDSVAKDLFLTQLQSDLYQIQSYSIRHQSQVILTFYPLSNKYVAREVTRKTILTRQLSAGIKISSSSNLEDITFYPDGNTNRFGKVNFKAGDGILQLMFQIGQGRFYVQEL
ncbi:competence type IV pilus minor pilin ComGD [Bacillus sp. KH172YL63]|uniref:competence type IV pilus minor pilin ComGD n=1 Tax=Bacillus sp. KH172YL63 TaxID=2709784 RepID=UPI0013E465AF|nr:competence type IV pilus minor pilin ComGD [Bacillus sp. KH172YL63]BCB04718.1 hypothetical protein KH172YL63_28510 [Bacillus sp. KH172YL63]